MTTPLADISDVASPEKVKPPSPQKMPRREQQKSISPLKQRDSSGAKLSPLKIVKLDMDLIHKTALETPLEYEDDESCIVETQNFMEASLLHNQGHYAGSSEELSKQCNMKD